MKRVTGTLIYGNAPFFEEVVQQLNDGKSVMITVSGSSMLPALWPGDTVSLQHIEQSTVRIGDVVLAKYKGAYILHRIIWKHADYYYLAGDGNRLQIEKVKLNELVAVVVRAFRGEKLLQMKSFFNTLYWTYRCVTRPFWYWSRKIKK